jgi:formate dehydrogenase iron-sulfur subunit
VNPMDRRAFFQTAGAAIGCAGCGASHAAMSEDAGNDAFGILVDTTECIGCRKCEWACNQENHLSDNPLESFEDTSVFDQARRMTPDAFTVVNRYPKSEDPGNSVYAKVQCMHCVRPACVSACLVGALTKTDTGAVVYDAWKCIGCRYCMVACPFEVPAYEFEDAFTPQVRKCTMCFDRISKPPADSEQGETWAREDIFETGMTGQPACVAQCPPQALVFGKRGDLIQLARQRIAEKPESYYDHIYGEHEVGGTAWMYLAAQPFEELGFQAFRDDPVPELSEAIQHSVLRYGIPPLLVFGMLGAAMKVLRPADEERPPEAPSSSEEDAS